jgi:hypothetical protein
MDPSSLLARGYTARFLGSNLLAIRKPVISALSKEEIEKDLRHITAFVDASTRYHQLTYASTNHLSIQTAAAADSTAITAVEEAGLVTSSSSSVTNAAAAKSAASNNNIALPVRLDPEEEQRLAETRLKIARAEAVREELEQQYVALRAHYVWTTQNLKTVAEHFDQEIRHWQTILQDKLDLVALQRVRVQMARDVVKALIYRREALLLTNTEQPSQISDSKMDETTTTTTTTTTTAASSMQIEHSSATDITTTAFPADTDGSSTPLTNIWNTVEEEVKKSAIASVSSVSGSNTTTTATAVVSGRRGNVATAKAPSSHASSNVIWPVHNTMVPATPRNVPQLVSCASTVPEKSLAITTNGLFGSDPSAALVFFDRHLPIESGYFYNDDNKTNQDKNADYEDEEDSDRMMDDYDENLFFTEATYEKYASLEDRLEAEALTLERKLAEERYINRSIWQQFSKSRIFQDNTTAMISLVRQETESVLHRHNVLLESEEGMEAALRTTATSSYSTTHPEEHAEEEEVDDHNMSHPNPENDDDDTGEDEEIADINQHSQDSSHLEDEEEDDDDERAFRRADEKEDDEVDEERLQPRAESMEDWNSSTNTSKRSLDEGGPSTSAVVEGRKRRKL